MRPVLGDRAFTPVLVSPLQRARDTGELAGAAASAIIEPELEEWTYSKYEGPAPEQIHRAGAGNTE